MSKKLFSWLVMWVRYKQENTNRNQVQRGIVVVFIVGLFKEQVFYFCLMFSERVCCATTTTTGWNIIIQGKHCCSRVAFSHIVKNHVSFHWARWWTEPSLPGWMQTQQPTMHAWYTGSRTTIMLLASYIYANFIERHLFFAPKVAFSYLLNRPHDQASITC